MKKIFLIQVLLLSISFSEICDLNNDDSLNIVDIVIMVDSIINNTDEFCDMNGDNVLNVVDIISAVNIWPGQTYFRESTSKKVASQSKDGDTNSCR